ncbi:ATP-binding protein [Aerobium aerolatum]|uniref:histidine kinase n=1 Tax=Aquamicrobium aerolatum DSM 21857 TaxID=1121003 RepID=A0A1I3M7G1_9HYPH|nr:ATP-binding protein [Aquamicrobium aerolatum]SFI92974.1 two-component system, OmpR family, sensor histidine kinase QseC [Aquamicrobium aerolatum DSM 21857]
MTSIRSRLLTILIASTGLIWLFAVAWIYISTQAEVERVLDARLTEAARMVNSLLAERKVEMALATDTAGDAPVQFQFGDASYERQLSCQIWSLDGKLIGRSEHAPSGQLTQSESGFSQSVINGETWRVYSIENASLGVRVMVGDSIAVRDRLVGDVVKGLAIPAILILPFLAGAIWISVRRGMRPLNDMATALSSRAANDLQPLPQQSLPDEIVPAVHALNGLFQRVQEAREREKNFTTFAAHELKTPLAGLKTQAQVALASQDGDVHENALRQIAAGVDRTSRLVRQLLDLSSVEASDRAPNASSIRIADIVRRIAADMPSENARISIGGDLEASQSTDAVLLTLAIRNLIENALLHSQGTVQVGIAQDAHHLRVSVEDDGPGISEDELPRVTERFFRGRSKSPTGSGLGLAIVKEAASRLDGRLIFENRLPSGLRATLELPASPSR